MDMWVGGRYGRRPVGRDVRQGCMDGNRNGVGGWGGCEAVDRREGFGCLAFCVSVLCLV